MRLKVIKDYSVGRLNGIGFILNVSKRRIEIKVKLFNCKYHNIYIKW